MLLSFGVKMYNSSAPSNSMGERWHGNSSKNIGKIKRKDLGNLMISMEILTNKSLLMLGILLDKKYAKSLVSISFNQIKSIFKKLAIYQLIISLLLINLDQWVGDHGKI